MFLQLILISTVASLDVFGTINRASSPLQPQSKEDAIAKLSDLSAFIDKLKPHTHAKNVTEALEVTLEANDDEADAPSSITDSMDHAENGEVTVFNEMEESASSVEMKLLRDGYTVARGAFEYRTLGGTMPTMTYGMCQKDPLSLPAGYIIAPDDADSLAVIRAYPWSTSIITLASKIAYYSGKKGDTTEKYNDAVQLKVGNGKYSPVYSPVTCNGQILIRTSRYKVDGCVTWAQDCRQQTDAEQEDLMDAACEDKYGADSRAATYSELQDWDFTNSCGGYVMATCSGNDDSCNNGSPQSNCKSGHYRKGLANGKKVNEVWTDMGWGSRQTYCVRAPSLPTAGGCWFRLPSGCAKEESQQVKSNDAYTLDTHNTAKNSRLYCLNDRKSYYNSRCGVTDTMMVWNPEQYDGKGFTLTKLDYLKGLSDNRGGVLVYQEACKAHGLNVIGCGHSPSYKCNELDKRVNNETCLEMPSSWSCNINDKLRSETGWTYSNLVFYQSDPQTNALYGENSAGNGFHPSAGAFYNPVCGKSGTGEDISSYMAEIRESIRESIEDAQKDNKCTHNEDATVEEKEETSDEGLEYFDLIGCDPGSDCEKRTNEQQDIAIEAHKKIVNHKMQQKEAKEKYDECRNDKCEETIKELDANRDDSLHQERIKKFDKAIDILTRIQAGLDKSNGAITHPALLVTQEEKNILENFKLGRAVLFMLDEALTGVKEKDLVIQLKDLILKCIELLKESKKNEIKKHEEWIKDIDLNIQDLTNKCHEVIEACGELAKDYEEKSGNLEEEEKKRKDALELSDSTRKNCIKEHETYQDSMNGFNSELDAINAMINLVKKAKLGDDTVEIRDENVVTKHGVKESIGETSGQKDLPTGCKRATDESVWCEGPKSGNEICGRHSSYDEIFYSITAEGAAALGRKISRTTDCQFNKIANNGYILSFKESADKDCFDNKQLWQDKPSGDAVYRCTNLEDTYKTADFQLYKMPEQKLFSSGATAAMHAKYNNVCKEAGLNIIGCGTSGNGLCDHNRYANVPCIEMPKSWGCNIAQKLRDTTGWTSENLLFGDYAHYLNAFRPNGNAITIARPTATYSYRPVCGKKINAWKKKETGTDSD